MAADEKMKAAAKNVEGKAQEAMSEVTGDPKDKVEGQTKQVEAEARQTKEDVKDELRNKID